MKTWRERVVTARERGYFTKRDRALAWPFTTCAVGEHHASMPDVVLYVRGAHTQQPEDYTLLLLGSDFAWSVAACDFARCERLLDLIEDRVLELKREATS
jgi:hypothetical protein